MWSLSVWLKVITLSGFCCSKLFGSNIIIIILVIDQNSVRFRPKVWPEQKFLFCFMLNLNWWFRPEFRSKYEPKILPNWFWFLCVFDGTKYKICQNIFEIFLKRFGFGKNIYFFNFLFGAGFCLKFSDLFLFRFLFLQEYLLRSITSQN